MGKQVIKGAGAVPTCQGVWTSDMPFGHPDFDGEKNRFSVDGLLTLHIGGGGVILVVFVELTSSLTNVQLKDIYLHHTNTLLQDGYTKISTMFFRKNRDEMLGEISEKKH